MSISTINLGSSPTGAGGDTIREAFTKINTNFAGVDGGFVAGGAGFVNVSDEVTLDLTSARAFHHTMTGNITSLGFSNLPDELEFAPAWTWVLKINATGDYLLSGTPTVTWLNGGAWTDLNLAANAVNIVVFTRQGSVTYATLAWNGETSLDAYKVTFTANGTYPIATDAESIDLANYTKPAGDATIAFNKNGGSAITARTTFAVGDVLNAVVTGLTNTTAIRIPRYAL